MSDAQSTTRRIVSVLAADVVDYSRLMGQNPEKTLTQLQRVRETFDTLVTQHGGKEFGSVGDSLMAEFPTAIDAANAALSIQSQLDEINSSEADNEQMLLRIGLYMGDILEQDGQLYGDAVNIAARLQTLAPPGGICLSGAVHEQISAKFPQQFDYLGPQHVKNISRPIKAYAMSTGRLPWFSAMMSELKQRRVFRAALAYIVVSWVALQVVALVVDAYEDTAPDWILRAAITILVIGFLPAMILSWLYDVTPRGLKRSSGGGVSLKRKQSLGILGAGIVIAITGVTTWWIWSNYLEQNKYRVLRSSVANEPAVVAVAQFQNMTGNTELDWLGDAITNLVRNDLTRSRHMIVASHHRWSSIVGERQRDIEIARAADNAGVRYVVSGQYLQTPSGLTLTTQVSDLEYGSDLAPNTFQGLDQESFFVKAEDVARSVKNALRVPPEESISVFAADFPTHNLAAYEAYTAGINYILDYQHANALRSLDSAIVLAPEFWAAHARLSDTLYWMGDTEGAIEVLENIPKDAPMSQRLRQYIDASLAMRLQDMDKALAIYQQILSENSYEVEARHGLAEAYFFKYEEDEALRELDQLARQEPQNWLVWSTIGDLRAQIGQLDEAEEALQECLSHQPKDPSCLYYLGNVATERGDLKSAEEYYNRALEANANFHLSSLGLSRVYVASERIPQAINLLQQLVGDETIPAIDRIDAAFDLSHLLRSNGQFSQSVVPLQSVSDLIQREQVRMSLSLAAQAQAFFETGNYEKSYSLIDEAIAAFTYGPPTRYLFAKGLMATRQKDFAKTKAVIAEIHVLEESAEDDTEAKAAHYLAGYLALEQNDLTQAEHHLRASIDKSGYEYGLYEIGLAHLLHKKGQSEEASELLTSVLGTRNANDPRLDLERERIGSLLQHAKIQSDLGDQVIASQYAQRFLERWRESDPNHPDFQLAKTIAADTR
ncbi:MAG: tetratricopeptide repeat protein [Pseudomonadota bacterium]